LPVGFEPLFKLSEELWKNVGNTQAKQKLEHSRRGERRQDPAAFIHGNYGAVLAYQCGELFLRKAMLPAKHAQPVWRRLKRHRLPPFSLTFYFLGYLYFANLEKIKKG
jgi:hypothetical protein